MKIGLDGRAGTHGAPPASFVDVGSCHTLTQCTPQAAHFTSWV